MLITSLLISLYEGARLLPEDVVQMKKVSPPVSLGSKLAYTVSQFNISSLKTEKNVFVDGKVVGGESCHDLFWINEDILAGICKNHQVIINLFILDMGN